MQQSGMSVTKYLQHVGINYNTYNYWRKKLKENDSPKRRTRIFPWLTSTDPHDCISKGKTSHPYILQTL